MADIRISPTGYFIEDYAPDSFFELNLANALVELFRGESVIDVGCGDGRYVNYFLNNGIYAIGIDGNPYTRNLHGCFVDDATKDLSHLGTYDWVMSLEVGEHIPVEFEWKFIDNLHKLNRRGVVLSWAVEGQGGTGHVNCRNNNYIDRKFFSLGYIKDLEWEGYLRSQCNLCYWMKNSLLVYRKINNADPLLRNLETV